MRRLACPWRPWLALPPFWLQVQALPLRKHWQPQRSWQGPSFLRKRRVHLPWRLQVQALFYLQLLPSWQERPVWQLQLR